MINFRVTRDVKQLKRVPLEGLELAKIKATFVSSTYIISCHVAAAVLYTTRDITINNPLSPSHNTRCSGDDTGESKLDI